ncbi:MAG TPA: carbonic anhydrase [Sphingobacteriaceae bacterium]|nr:carbonic anhydrase [Sphingobacteriaceae bacterium]
MGKGINPVLQKGLDEILAGNREWMNMVATDETGRLKQLAAGQHPEILWIGCSDSRVPANQITGTLPGEVFVHRNIANICCHSDMNMLSVLDYAVNVLRVKHIIVAGHYGCGGVEAALSRRQHGIIDNWLSHIKDVYRLHQEEIESITNKKKRLDRMVELNVAEQVFNLCTTSIIQNAWGERNDLAVHGMVIVTGTGELVELGITFTGPQDLGKVFSFRKNRQ